MSTPAALNRLRVAELRARLEGAGLSTEGTKPVLVARLLAGLGGDTVAHTPDTPSTRRTRRLSTDQGQAEATPVKRGRASREVSAEPERPDTPSRRSRRLSVDLGPGEERAATPVKRSSASARVSASSRPSTPVRRSRRISGDLEPVMEIAAAANNIETIEEAAEEEVKEEDGIKKRTGDTACDDPKIPEPDASSLASAPDMAQHPHPQPISSTENKEEEKVTEISSDVEAICEKLKGEEPVLDGENNAHSNEDKVDDKESSKDTVQKDSKKAANDKIEMKENIPMPKLLDQVFSSKQIPRQKPKSGRFWKGERGQFRQIKRDKGQRPSFEQRLKLKEEKQRNKEVAEMLLQRKNQAKEDLRKRMEENKAKQLENQRKNEQYQVIKNPAKLKRMKKKQLRMLEKRDILAKN